jgi:hypothetical protein
MAISTADIGSANSGSTAPCMLELGGQNDAQMPWPLATGRWWVWSAFVKVCLYLSENLFLVLSPTPQSDCPFLPAVARGKPHSTTTTPNAQPQPLALAHGWLMAQPPHHPNPETPESGEVPTGCGAALSF